MFIRPFLPFSNSTQADKKFSTASQKWWWKNVMWFAINSLSVISSGFLARVYLWLLFAASLSIRVADVRREKQRKKRIILEGIRFSLFHAWSDLMWRSGNCDNETNSTNSCVRENLRALMWWYWGGRISAVEKAEKPRKLLSRVYLFISHLASSPRKLYA